MGHGCEAFVACEKGCHDMMPDAGRFKLVISEAGMAAGWLAGWLSGLDVLAPFVLSLLFLPKGKRPSPPYLISR